jgi:uncharacterized protein (TIGR02246 family)
MRKISAMVVLLLMCALSSHILAANAPAVSPDEAAIGAVVDSYVAAYNRGDAKAVAEHWSETGQWLSPSGERFQGKQAIQGEMEALFKEYKGVQIAVDKPTIRVVAPDAAIEEGTVHVSRPGEPREDSTYLAIHVKKNGKWKLDSVRETSLPSDQPETSSPLAELAWMVGDWIDTSDDATIETSVKWTPKSAFLVCSFRLSAPGMEELTGTQVIGWDAVHGQIRSWAFDSDGGVTAGTWTRKEDRWIVNSASALADGRAASSVNIYSYLDSSKYTWQSTGREVDGEVLPNIEPVTVVRKGTPK